MTKILMLASFGLEIVECGGALARHSQAGDSVHAAVLLSKPESRPQIREAAAVLAHQMAFIAEVTEKRVNPSVLHHILPEYDDLRDDKTALGLAL